MLATTLLPSGDRQIIHCDFPTRPDISFMIPFSILDLAPIAEGSSASISFQNTLDLAQHGERWGYNRYWLAEHHGMPGIASAATAVVIAHVAAGTKTIRVGAGGVMLPNHSPLVIAEQFGTLEALHPGPHRPGPGPRARLRPDHGARAAARPAVRRRPVPAGCAGTDRLHVRRAAPARAGRARQGRQCAGLDSRFQPVRRATGGPSGLAVCLCLAFRAADDDAGRGLLPRTFQAVEAAGQAVCDARL